MNYKNLSVEVEDGIMQITIKREDKLNALNLGLIAELNVAIQELYDNAEIKGCIITGKGEKAFAAGADISEFVGMNAADAKKMSKNGHDVFNKIENAPKPVIAAVNGFALGGGCELAIACHIRLASKNAKFGQPEVNLGIIPGYGGTQRMPQLVGKGKAFELLMTGDMIDAQEAYRLGLVNKIVEANDLIEEAKSMLKKIATKAPIAIAKVIKSVNACYEDGVNGFETEINEFAFCAGTEDFKEGASAFLEKRKAEFKGK